MKFWNRLRLLGSVAVIALAAIATVAALLRQADSPPAPAPRSSKAGPSGL